jgi:hypothetical protein
MMEAACTSEMPVHFHHTIWHYIQEDSHFHTPCHENLKSNYQEYIPIFIRKRKRKNGNFHISFLAETIKVQSEDSNPIIKENI